MEAGRRKSEPKERALKERVFLGSRHWPSPLRGETWFPNRERGFVRRTQRHDGDLRVSTESKWDSPVARARIDVEQRVAGTVTSHGVLEKRRRQAPAKSREGELAPVRVAAQCEGDAALGEYRPKGGIMRERDDRRRGRDAGERALDIG